MIIKIAVMARRMEKYLIGIARIRINTSKSIALCLTLDFVSLKGYRREFDRACLCPYMRTLMGIITKVPPVDDHRQDMHSYVSNSA